MRLVAARVRNLRSIIDSGKVEIEDRVTFLVGRNEQGKTTFLRGLASYSEKYAYMPTDMPTRLRPSLEQKDSIRKASVPVVGAAQELDGRQSLTPKRPRPVQADLIRLDTDNLGAFHYVRRFRHFIVA